MNNPFDPIVIIEHGPRIAVTSVRQATQCLVDGWSEKGRGKAYRAACKACVAALVGERDAESARLAFIAAAKEVDVFVCEGPPIGG
jgi:hypothetical protein